MARRYSKRTRARAGGVNESRVGYQPQSALSTTSSEQVSTIENFCTTCSVPLAKIDVKIQQDHHGCAIYRDERYFIYESRRGQQRKQNRNKRL